MAKYEMMFIARSDIPEEEIDKLVAQMEGVVSGAGGKTEKVEKMGRRRLAYRIRKQREGYYLLFTYEGTGDTVREFERRLKVSDIVIKHLAVRVDERPKSATQAVPKAAAAAAEATPSDAAPIRSNEEAASQT